MTVRLAFTLCVLELAGLNGCATVQPPVIRFVGVGQTESSPEAMTIEFTAEIENPNPEPIELFELNYKLSIAGKAVFHCRRAPLVNLPASGIQRLTLPAVIPYSRIGMTANQAPYESPYEVRGECEYLLQSEIALILSESGLHRPSVDFSDSGLCRLGFSRSTEVAQ